MPDFLEHLRQAKHNQACSVFLIENKLEFRDWAITSAFYAALHYTEACYPITGAHSGKNVDDTLHRKRGEVLQQRAPTAYREYRTLERACSEVRYLKLVAWRQYYNEANATNLVKVTLPAFLVHLQRESGINLS
jgi:hypothetical protein